MALAANCSSLSTKSLHQPHPAAAHQLRLPTLLPATARPRPALRPISAVHAAEPAKNPVVADKPPLAAPSPVVARPGVWAVDSWRSKKALQLPEYPNQQELDSVLHTIESFPPIVFAGEARKLEDRLANAAV